MISHVVSETYLANWQSFSTWKAEYARKSLLGLLVARPASDDDSDWSDDEGSCISILPSSSSTTSLSATPLIPTPGYTSTTPLRRSILIGDDPNPLPFLPYADDPEFDHEGYMNAHYDGLAWQDHCASNPDIEVICTQTVKQLMVDYGLTLQEIVECHVIPRHILQNLELYTGARRRDYPPWPAASPLHPSNVPYSPTYSDTSSPSHVLADLGQYFCTSDCHFGYCNTHNNERRVLPQPTPPTLTLTTDVLYNNLDKPCSKHCFLLGSHTQSLPYWSPEDIEILHITLRYSPDTLPCDLAVIVRKPCNETANQRQQWLTSQKPPTSTQQTSTVKPPLTRKNTNPKVEFLDFDADTFIPTDPCTHPGLCTLDNPDTCPCAQSGAHCTGTCDCSAEKQKCIRSWRGCTCTKSRVTSGNKTCGTARCPCFRAHRECDPVLCVKCCSRDPEADVCKNSLIQHMRHKRGVVHRSKWGLGYYILESAREGDLITEYVGDLIYEPTVRSRDVIAAHSRRQYMFKLNSLFTVDGTLTGNESRYINHASGDKANVHAHVRLVNNEHRIGIFACKDILPGTELLLDYGSDFFHTHTYTPSQNSRLKYKSKSQSQAPPRATSQQTRNINTTSTSTSIPSTTMISDSPLVLSPSFLASQSPLGSSRSRLGIVPQKSPTPVGPTRKVKTSKTMRVTRRKRYLIDLSHEKGEGAREDVDEDEGDEEYQVSQREDGSLTD